MLRTWQRRLNNIEPRNRGTLARGWFYFKTSFSHFYVLFSIFCFALLVRSLSQPIFSCFHVAFVLAVFALFLFHFFSLCIVLDVSRPRLSSFYSLAFALTLFAGAPNRCACSIVLQRCIIITSHFHFSLQWFWTLLSIRFVGIFPFCLCLLIVIIPLVYVHTHYTWMHIPKQILDTHNRMFVVVVRFWSVNVCATLECVCILNHIVHFCIHWQPAICSYFEGSHPYFSAFFNSMSIFIRFFWFAVLFQSHCILVRRLFYYYRICRFWM